MPCQKGMLALRKPFDGQRERASVRILVRCDGRADESLAKLGHELLVRDLVPIALQGDVAAGGEREVQVIGGECRRCLVGNGPDFVVGVFEETDLRWMDLDSCPCCSSDCSAADDGTEYAPHFERLSATA